MPSEVDGRSGSSDGTDVGRVRGRLCVVRSETARVMLTFLVGERVFSRECRHVENYIFRLFTHWSLLKTENFLAF